MISQQKTSEVLGRLALLKRFPGNPNALAALGEMFGELCRNDHEASLLVDALLKQYSEWPGPGAVRQIHNERIIPRRLPEDRPDDCGLCRSGLRESFEIFERQPGGGSTRRLLVSDTASAFATEQELYKQYGDSTAVKFYGCVTPCTCPLGRTRRDEMRRREAEKGNGKGQ